MIESVPEAAPPVILIADDDEDIRSLVAFRLEHSGFGVLQARNGVEAVLLAREHHPALLVLDVFMPNLDGSGVMRELRMDEATSRIPVILLTARVQERDVMHGFEEGVSDYLKKPFSPNELLGGCGRFSQARQARARRPRRTPCWHARHCASWRVAWSRDGVQTAEVSGRTSAPVRRGAD